MSRDGRRERSDLFTDGDGHAHEGLPNARTEVFSDASHFFLMEQPHKFMALLTGWLQAH